MAVTAGASGLVARFLGSAVSESLAFAAGVALGPVLGPPTQLLRNEVNAKYPYVPPSAVTLAAGVAQGQVDEAKARTWAKEHGIGDDAFTALVAIADVGPAFGLLLESFRRGLIDEGAFDTGLHRLAIEPQWWGALRGLAQALLSPSEMANARQQGFVSEARQKQEAALHGIDAERAEIQYLIAGLPPGPATMQEAVNRGLADEATFDQAIREGHTKTKYTPLLYALRHPVLSATEYASAALRTWVTKEEMYAGGALTGHTQDQMDLLFLNRGRPASPGQIWTAAARKIAGPRGVPTSFEDHAKAIAISDIRPEYAELLWGIRHVYPSLFQLNRLVEAKTVDPATAATWATYNRYAPEVVQALQAAWAKGSKSAAGKDETAATLRTEYEGYLLTEAELRAALAALGFDPSEVDREVHLGDAARVKTYRDKALEAAHKSYLSTQLTSADVQTYLGQLHISPAAVTELIALWDIERQVTRKTLTTAQIRAAFRRGAITQAEAITDLEEHGLSATDAATFLAS